MSQQGERGFTLLELLVALAVFALVASISYVGLRTVMQAQSSTDAHAERLKRMQGAVLMLERDLNQLVYRPIRDQLGDYRAAFLGSDYGRYRIEFTRVGRANPLGVKRSRLQRVAYGLKENTLVRYSWLMLDRAAGSEPRAQPLLEGVEAMELRFLTTANEWTGQWAVVSDSQNVNSEMPRAVELTLKMMRLGDIRRLIMLPQSSPDTEVAAGVSG